MRVIKSLLLAFIVALEAGCATQPTPTSLSSEQTLNMTQFATVDQSGCIGACYGWGPAVASPNGKYIYKNHDRHYGWHWFAVLTSDYSRVVYFNDGGDMYGLMGGGCEAKQWEADGQVSFVCYNSGISAVDKSISVEGQVDPETGRVVTTTLVTPTSLLTDATPPSGLTATPPSVSLPAGALAQFECGTGISGIAISPDGASLAAISPGGITLCDMQTHEIKRLLEAEHATSSRPAWSPDGRLIAGASTGAALHIWEAASGQEVNSIPVTFADEGSVTEGYKVYGIAWSPDGGQIAAGDGAPTDSSLRIWDSASGKRLLTIGEYNIAEVAWSPDGKRIAGGSLLGEVVIWDAATGKEQTRYGELYTPSVGSFDWSPDGSRIAVGLLPTIIVYDTATDQEVTRLLADETGSFLDVTWSPDGSLLAATLPDMRQMWIWDTSTWDRLATVDTEDELWNLAWSPDGKVIATRSGDSTITVWAVDQLVKSQ